MNTTQELSKKYSPPHIRRPDEFLEQEAIWNLTQNGAVDGRYLQVKVRDGILVLTGEVSSRPQKMIAQACVEQVSGVVHVENQLKIKRVSRFRDDHSMHGF